MSVSMASTVTIAMTVLMATQDVHDSQVNAMHPAYVKELGYQPALAPSEAEVLRVL